VISEVGDDPKVVGLVYVCAYVPDVGKSANDTSNPFGPTPGQKAIKVDAQHFAWMSEDGILNSFAEGLPMAERRIVLAVQGQIYGPMLDEAHARSLEVEAVMARDRHQGSHAQSRDGGSRCEESPRSRDFDSHLSRRHAARAAKGC
jgi:hypothetical protein